MHRGTVTTYLFSNDWEIVDFVFVLVILVLRIEIKKRLKKYDKFS